MADLAEDVLTTYDDRLYFTLDAAITIAASQATVPVGFTELDENSTYSARRRAVTGDGQTRATRGHAKPVKVNAEDTITFNLKPKDGVDPIQDREIDKGTLLKLLLVRSDGKCVLDSGIVTEITEGSDIAGMPTFSGTLECRAHPIRGVITTWPPA